jgi:hypothetical protein
MGCVAMDHFSVWANIQSLTELVTGRHFNFIQNIVKQINRPGRRRECQGRSAT